MRNLLHHCLNARHFYCRLLGIGLPKRWAKKIAVLYEKISTPLLYHHHHHSI